MSDNDRDKRIKAEIKRLNAILKEVDKTITKGVKSLIENAAFMAVTLEDLQETINRDGVIDEYQNGANQFGKKESSEVKIYNTMIKNHVTIMKQLTDLLGKQSVKVENDDLMNFIKGDVK